MHFKPKSTYDEAHSIMMFETTSSRMRNQLRGLLTNRWALLCFTILFFEQMIEASATLWLVKIMEQITSGQSFFSYLIIYLCALSLPYIPRCLAYVFRASWKQEAQRSFIESFVAHNKNKITDWNNKSLREEKLSILTAEGPNALNQLIDYVFDFFWYASSVFLNILALTLVVEPLFAVAYGFSIIAVFLILKLQRRSQHQLTKKALVARVDLAQSLLAAWDNVLLGNWYNFHIWQDRTTQRVNRCLKRNVDLEQFDQVMAIFVSLITTIPSLAVVIYSAIRFSHDPVRLSSFVVTLPILFIILSYTYQTLSLSFRWAMHRSKLEALYRAIQASGNSTPMEKKVRWEKIRLFNESPASDDQISLAGPKILQSQNDLLQHTTQPGRLTIRGENGAGKSTALMMVKHALGDRAFFLPTHNQLSFSGEDLKHSTGESLKNRLLEILAKVEAHVLLLDEWDANLDTENSEYLSQLIDEIASSKCVIEVRHHR